MKQYCRYCQSLTTGNGIWCEKHQRTYSEKYAKTMNNCGDFELNVIDAFFENERGYQPREPKGRCKECKHFMTNNFGKWCIGRDGCDKFEPRYRQTTLDELIWSETDGKEN